MPDSTGSAKRGKRKSRSNFPLIRYRNDNVIGQIRVNSSNGIYGSFTNSSGNNITELQAAASASDDTVNASESFNQSKTSFWDFADSFSGNDSLPISLRQMKSATNRKYRPVRLPFCVM